MRKLVVFPSDPMQAYLDLGLTYEYFNSYFNPENYFDFVYVLSPWGEVDEERHERIIYQKIMPWKMKDRIQEVRPCVIRAYGGYRCMDWMALNGVDSIPTLVSVHDTNPDLIYDSIKYADNVISMSKAVQEAVRRKTDCSDKGEWVMGNRVDTDVFSYTTDLAFFKYQNSRYGHGRHILHVGRKSRQKNLDTVIRALPLLPEDVSVIFIGKGDFSPYGELAESLSVKDRVFNIDHIENNDLPKWYSWCDCFCTPSRWEGFGFVFIEAASCETAIVTSDIAPMHEFLTNNENAILVREYEDPEAIAGAILKAIDHSPKITKMKVSARRVGKRFSKPAVDMEEVRIYEEVIRRGPRERMSLTIEDRYAIEQKYRRIFS